MAAEPATMRSVAEGLMGDLDAIAAAMVAAYRERIPDYTDLLDKHGEDVYSVSRNAALIFLRLVIEDRFATDEELSVIRIAGRARADQGLSLDAMLQAYSVGREVAFDIIRAAAEAAEVDEEEVSRVTLLVAAFMEKLALMVTQGFLEHIHAAYKEESRRLNALVDLGTSINRSLDLDEVVNVGLDRTRQALRVEWAGLWLVTLEKGSVRLFRQQLDESWTEARGVTETEVDVPLGEGSLGRAARDGTPLFYGPDNLPDNPRVRSTKCRMVAIVPLLYREHSLGLLGIASNRRESLTTRDQDFLRAIADQMAVAVHQVQEHMREARTDFLTGLANRHEFDSFLRRELSRAKRFGDPLCVAMMDLDGLKRLNDEAGHRAGDEALRTIGSTLKATVRTLDLAARIGGDEFALVMPQTDLSGAHDVLSRFQEHVAELRGSGQPGLSISVGFAQWEEGQTLDALCATADGKLYEAKRARPVERP